MVQSREWQARIRDQVATEFATVALAPPDLREQYEEAAGEYAKVFKRVVVVEFPSEGSPSADPVGMLDNDDEGALDIQQFEIVRRLAAFIVLR